MRPAALSVLLPALLGAQEVPFTEDSPRPWEPAWEFRAQREKFHLSRGDLWRTRSQLRLRWSFEGDGPFSLRVGSGHALSTDRNVDNLPMFDDSASRGSWLDLAALGVRHLGTHTHASLEAGLVENPLLLSEAAWDPVLRVIGASGQVGWRGEGLVEDLSLRAVGGQVRLIAGGRVRIAGLQAVAKLETGPLQWTLHTGVLDLEPREEDAAGFRRENPAQPASGGGGGGYSATGPYATYAFKYLVYGAGFTTQGPLPLEVKGQRLVHQESKQVGEEFQAWVGSPRRAWWPQVGYVRQRLDAYGALASVNGDQWWFHADADGQRYALALNLPARWRAEVSLVEQTRRGASFVVKRGIFSVIKRF
jgi:hypothetical protein